VENLASTFSRGVIATEQSLDRHASLHRRSGAPGHLPCRQFPKTRLLHR
jgi:hypothetical protein